MKFQKKNISIFFKFFFACLLILWNAACAADNGQPNILLAPAYLSIDATNNRLFVVDSQNNGFSLISLTDNSIVTGAPLLNSSSSITLPQLPQDIAALNLGSGVSRIFIIGNGAPPRNQITVLDYSSSTGLQVASISPITVGSTNTDILGGLAIDQATGNLFVSDTTASVVRAYNSSTGAELAGSPLSVQTSPSRMEVNESISRLFVSSLGGNLISIIDTTNLLAAATTLDVGFVTSDVSATSNGSGTALFVISPASNQVKVFNFNVTTPSSSTQIGSTISPPAVGTAPASTDPLSGSVAEVASATLSTGVLVGGISESTGDFGVIDVSADLSGFSTARVSTLNGLGAEGVAILTDGSGNGTTAYIASPGVGAVSFINIITNAFAGQIL